MNQIKKKKINELALFDVAEYLKSDKDLAQYLNAVLEDGDPALFVAAIAVSYTHLTLPTKA